MIDNRISWKIKLGLILLIIGLIISIFMADFMGYYSREIGEEPDSHYFIYLSIRIAGNVIGIIGFIFMLLGFIDQARIYRHPIGPPVNQGFNPNNFMIMQFTLCKGCQRKIPFDSNLCPYCGLNQSESGTIT